MDEFSDDGLDGLNESVLQELENNAIRSTQAHAAAPQPQDNVLGYEFEDDDLDDTIVIDEQAPQPPRPPSVKTAVPVPQPRHVAGLAGTQRWNQPLLPPRPTYPSRTQYPAPRRPVPQPPPSQRFPPLPSGRAQPPPPRSQFVRPLPPIPRPYSHQPSQALHATGPAKQNEIIAALQARLSELESDLTAAKGEAAILRSKYEKAQATHDAEVTRLKKQSAEQLAKQERAIEAARTAERTASTELEFARQELREGLGRAKSKRKDGPATPKKNKTWGMADGFDGVEILSSPSNKGQGLRRKDSGATALPPPERTPSKGKRKRPIVDSPTFALETDSGDAVFDGLHAASAPSGPPWRAHNPLPFDFLRLVLDHSAVHGQSPTFDLFSRFAFPSDPGQSFASIIFQKLPQMGNPREPLRLLSDFADLVIDMWQRCLSEKYHAPIFYLAALVLYTLDLNVVAVAPHIISSLVPVCATTCCLVALPRFNSIDGDMSAHPDTVVRQLCLDIDVTQCLAVLYLAALGCLSAPLEESDASDAPRPSPQTQFWKTMDLDFVLMMLNPKHPEADWFCMVSLVGTSVARDSIGPVSSPATNSSGCPAERRDPKVVAATLIECVSWYLCHSTKWAPSGSTKEIVVRLAALRTLVMFATSPFGALQMAGSDFAIPRLVTVLCWAIDMLYDMDVTPPRPRKAGQRQTDLDESTTEKGDNMDLDDDLNGARDMRPDGEGQRQPNDGVESEREAAAVQETVDPDPASVLCRLISQATQLLHFLVTDSRTADVANTATKLAASHGGSQRYLLTLARLNFAEEDLVLEAGIDAETMELAHELLELAVTPDEGDEIGDMFGV